MINAAVAGRPPLASECRCFSSGRYIDSGRVCKMQTSKLTPMVWIFYWLHVCGRELGQLLEAGGGGALSVFCISCASLLCTLVSDSSTICTSAFLLIISARKPCRPLLFAPAAAKIIYKTWPTEPAGRSERYILGFTSKSRPNANKTPLPPPNVSGTTVTNVSCTPSPFADCLSQ